jgi:hypothetical protein
MAIEATVIPQGVPQIGTEVTADTFQQIATPRVFVPTDQIKIDSGETLQIDGTLVVNGTLIGSGLPQPSGVATGLANMNDVQLSSLQSGQVLKWDGARWTNLADEEGTQTVGLEGLNNVQIGTPTIGQSIRFDGTNWINAVDQAGVENLTQLHDTELTNIEVGQILQWSGTKWINYTQDYTTSLAELEDMDISTPIEDLSAIQYNATRGLWESVPVNDFVDGLIDGGHADTIHIEMLDIDGGRA